MQKHSIRQRIQRKEKWCHKMEKKLAVIVDNNEEITTEITDTEMCSSACDVAMKTCSSENHDAYRNSGTFIAEIGGFTALFGEVQSVCHLFATRKNKKDVMKEERVNMLNNQHVRPYNML